MKTILMLIVGLMLAGCGSTGNHAHNRDLTGSAIRIRRCCGGGHDMRLPLTLNHGVASTYRPASQDRARIALTARFTTRVPL